MFGKNFIQVTNDDDLSSLERKTDKLYVKLLNWSKQYPSNDKALEWKQAELSKKRR